MGLSNTELTAALGGLATTLALYYLLTKKENRYPSGPFAFPVIGNLPQLALAGSITKFANYYRKAYGDVSSTYFNIINCTIVSRSAQYIGKPKGINKITCTSEN